MNKLHAGDLYRAGEAIEKKSWLPLFLAFFGFVNMFFQIPHVDLPWRYLLLVSWIYPGVVSFYIIAVAAGMMREANRNFGSDAEEYEP